jgi:azurin
MPKRGNLTIGLTFTILRIPTALNYLEPYTSVNSLKTFFKACILGLSLLGLSLAGLMNSAIAYAKAQTATPSQQIIAPAAADAASASPSSKACQVTLTTDDAPRFNVPQIGIPFACPTFTVVLKHTGRLPKAATGHNWVLVATQQVNAVTYDGSKAGVNQNYIKPNDVRIIAFIPIVGRGETADVSFSTAHLLPNESYTFLSTVDGQSAVMRGVIRRF